MAVKQLRQLAKGNNLCQPVGFAFRFREDFQKIFPDGIFHEKRLRILGQHTDAAGDGQLAAIGFPQTGKQPHGGRFARAVAAEQRKKFALVQLQQQTFHDIRSVFVVLEP